MSLPIFYLESIDHDASSFFLNEETSKHIIQVLRMTTGEQLQLTDGKGYLLLAEITDDNRKKCGVKKISGEFAVPKSKKVSIAISPVKNNSRFEWFLEKATEIGVSEIIPLICDRTEKQHFRTDRMRSILVSAMLQSKQTWLPVLQEPTRLETIIKNAGHTQKLIAHCESHDLKNQLRDIVNEDSSIILIGPEGDFTSKEILTAKENNFTAVALGNTRLRTETAGVYAAVLLCV